MISLLGITWNKWPAEVFNDIFYKFCANYLRFPWVYLDMWTFKSPWPDTSKSIPRYSCYFNIKILGYPCHFFGYLITPKSLFHASNNIKVIPITSDIHLYFFGRIISHTCLLCVFIETKFLQITPDIFYNNIALLFI